MPTISPEFETITPAATDAAVTPSAPATTVVDAELVPADQQFGMLSDQTRAEMAAGVAVIQRYRPAPVIDQTDK
jgi:hypothetical protein